jgi:hypothetical protein
MNTNTLQGALAIYSGHQAISDALQNWDALANAFSSLPEERQEEALENLERAANTSILLIEGAFPLSKGLETQALKDFRDAQLKSLHAAILDEVA